MFGLRFDYGGAIETTDGAVTITGNVSGTNSVGDGIRMVQGGQVRSTGTGTIDIAGSITGAGSGGRGIVLAHGGTGITTKDGTISITGTSININSLDVHTAVPNGSYLFYNRNPRYFIGQVYANDFNF